MPPPCSDVEAATLAPNGSPPITRITLPTCRAHYPGGSSGCSCRLLPRSRGLPQMAGGSASALSLSRPAQASLALRPAGSLSCPRQPLSRGSSPCGYPHEPLVSYQINRQLSGWILPPLMIRAFGAHCQLQTHAPQQLPSLFDHLVGAGEQCRWNVEAELLAALRLTTSSYLVGACTGRSAGFSPLRMRSTYPAACLYWSM